MQTNGTAWRQHQGQNVHDIPDAAARCTLLHRSAPLPPAAGRTAAHQTEESRAHQQVRHAAVAAVWAA